MKASANNFFYFLKNIVTGGDTSDINTLGILTRDPGVSLASVTGSAGTAAGVGLQQISFDVNLAAGPPAGTSAGDMVTTFVPGYRFKLIALDFVTSIAGTGASASQLFNLEIGTTNVTLGVCTIVLADTSSVGEFIAGAAITGANIGTATDSFSIEQAASGTAFTAGAGTFIVTIQNLDTADNSTAADETNALVRKIEATTDTLGHITWAVPRDYDEVADILILRVLTSMLTVSTDTDVELDSEMYVKVPGSALGADVDPTKPGTVISTTETWIELPLSGNSLTRDDVAHIKLISNGGNDTVAEEIIIHSVELVYRSCIVSYDHRDSSDVSLR